MSEQLYHCQQCDTNKPLAGFAAGSADCLECERRMASVDLAVSQLHAERKSQKPQAN
jgi:hypothetical protein